MKKLSIEIVLVVLFISCFFLPKKNVEAAKIIIATDLHYLSNQLYDDGLAYQYMLNNSDGRYTQGCDVILETFIQEVIQQQPDVVILSGDLSFNGELLSHQQLANALQKIHDAQIDVLVIPGNHDISATSAASFIGQEIKAVETIDAQQFQNIYGNLGSQNAISWDETSLSYTYQINKDLYLIMIDTNAYGKNFVHKETLDWLQQQLQDIKKQNAQVITVTHQNIYAHNDLLKLGYQLYNGDELKTLLENNHVSLHLSGHIHLQHYVKGKLTEITTSSLLVPPLQYGIINFDGNFHYQTKTLSFANEIISDDLTQLACDFFDQQTKRRAFTRLQNSDFNQIEKEAMADLFTRLNAYYFAGKSFDPTEYTNKLDSFTTKDNFFSSYLEIILSEANTNFNRITVNGR